MLFRKTAVYAMLVLSVLSLQACAGKYRAMLADRGVAFTPESFFQAVEQQQSDVVELFARAGFDVNMCKPDSTGMDENATALTIAVWQRDLKTAAVLLDNGYKVNREKCPMKTPPLHIASMRGFRDMAALLVSKGADVNRKDQIGYTPLQLARQMHRSDMVVFLESKGAK